MAVGFRMVRHWPSQVIIVAAALLFIGVQATLAYRYISADKAQTIEAAYADDEAVVLAVNAHIGAVLQLADSTLQQLAVHIEQHGGMQSLDPAVLHDMLLLHAQGATMLRAIIVVAPDGTAITSSTIISRPIGPATPSPRLSPKSFAANIVIMVPPQVGSV